MNETDEKLTFLLVNHVTPSNHIVAVSVLTLRRSILLGIVTHYFNIKGKRNEIHVNSRNVF